MGSGGLSVCENAMQTEQPATEKVAYNGVSQTNPIFFPNLDISGMSSPNDKSIDSGYENSLMESPKLSFCTSPTVNFETVQVTEVGTPIFEKVTEILPVETFCATEAVDTSEKERFLEFKSTINTYGYYLKWTKFCSFLVVEENESPNLEMITEIDVPEIDFCSATKCEDLSVVMEEEELVIRHRPRTLMTDRSRSGNIQILSAPTETAYGNEVGIPGDADKHFTTTPVGAELILQYGTNSDISK